MPITHLSGTDIQNGIFSAEVFRGISYIYCVSDFTDGNCNRQPVVINWRRVISAFDLWREIHVSEVSDDVIRSDLDV